MPALSITDCTTLRPSGEMEMYGRSTPGRPIVVANRIGSGAAAGALNPRPNHPAAAAIIPTAARAAIEKARKRKEGAAPGAFVPEVKWALASALAKSPALGKRSAGSFSRAMATAAATLGGTDLRSSVTGRGASVMIFMMICCAEAHALNQDYLAVNFNDDIDRWEGVAMGLD
jgi:hypothetical protein